MANLPVEFFWNLDRGFQSQENGKAKIQNGQELRVTLFQKPIWGITCMKDTGEVQTFNLTDTFSFVADDDFNVLTTEPIRSPNSEFNIPGDWAGLDVANGKISVRIDANTAELQTKLGDDGEIKLIGEIQVFEMGETEPYIIARLQPLIARNLVDQSGVTPPPVTTGYYNSAQVDALLAGKEDVRTRKAVVAFDATATPTVTLHTVTSGTSGVPITLWLIIESITGSITNNFVYDLGITGDTTKYINGGVAPAGFDAVGEILPIDLNGFDIVPALSDLILTITTGSDATTMSVKAVTDITEY